MEFFNMGSKLYPFIQQISAGAGSCIKGWVKTHWFTLKTDSFIGLDSSWVSCQLRRHGPRRTPNKWTTSLTIKRKSGSYMDCCFWHCSSKKNHSSQNKVNVICANHQEYLPQVEHGWIRSNWYCQLGLFSECYSLRKYKGIGAYRMVYGVTNHRSYIIKIRYTLLSSCIRYSSTLNSNSTIYSTGDLPLMKWQPCKYSVVFSSLFP